MYELTFGLFNKLVSLCDTLYNFLFQEITIGTYTVSMWQLIGGTLFVVLITMWLVKKLVPVA